MDTRKARALLSGIKPGDTIKAVWLNSLVSAINSNTRAIRSPQQKRSITPANLGEAMSPGDAPPGGGASLGAETFKAYADDITSSTETLTDSNGDTVDVEVITQLDFIETTTGRAISLVIDYDNNRP